MSPVAWSVCLCVGQTGKLYKNGWTDRDAAWGLTHVGPMTTYEVGTTSRDTATDTLYGLSESGMGE